MFMFIKGTLDQPKCKFTRRLVEMLKPYNYRNIKTLNILENERIRQWLKFYSKWPTFPQVYINQKFVGGIDVIAELEEDKEFDAMVPEQCKPQHPKAALAEFLSQNDLVCFKTEASEVPA